MLLNVSEYVWNIVTLTAVLREIRWTTQTCRHHRQDITAPRTAPLTAFSVQQICYPRRVDVSRFLKHSKRWSIEGDRISRLYIAVVSSDARRGAVASIQNACDPTSGSYLRKLVHGSRYGSPEAGDFESCFGLLTQVTNSDTVILQAAATLQ